MICVRSFTSPSMEGVHCAHSERAPICHAQSADAVSLVRADRTKRLATRDNDGDRRIVKRKKKKRDLSFVFAGSSWFLLSFFFAFFFLFVQICFAFTL